MEVYTPTNRVSNSGPINPLVGYLRLSYAHAYRADSMVVDFTDIGSYTGFSTNVKSDDVKADDKGIPIT